MRYWDSSKRQQRRRRARRPRGRVDNSRPMRHSGTVQDRKDWNRLADYVLRERKQRGITQQQLAELMDVNIRSVRRIEKGESVSKTTLAAIDVAFGAPSGTARKILLASPNTPEPAESPQGKAAIERLLSMTREEMLREAELYDEIEPGSGDEWLRRVLEIRRRAQTNPNEVRDRATR